MQQLPPLGTALQQARKKRFPADDQRSFALRLGVSRATLQKMEQGDLSVSLKSYYDAANLLDTQADFAALFTLKGSLFDD